MKLMGLNVFAAGDCGVAGARVATVYDRLIDPGRAQQNSRLCLLMGTGALLPDSLANTRKQWNLLVNQSPSSHSSHFNVIAKEGDINKIPSHNLSPKLSHLSSCTQISSRKLNRGILTWRTASASQN